MRTNHRLNLDDDTELNLIPFLNFFVGLIPFLLLATTLTGLGSLEIGVPSMREGLTSIDDSNDAYLVVRAQSSSTKIFVIENGQERKELRAETTQAPMESVRSLIDRMNLSLKPRRIRALLEVDPDLSYAKAVQLIDELKSISWIESVLWVHTREQVSLRESDRGAE